MSNIAKLVTQAHLMEVKVLDFSAKIEEMDLDLHNIRLLGEKYNTKMENKELQNKFNELRTLATEWVTQAGLRSHRRTRIVILMEEDTAE